VQGTLLFTNWNYSSVGGSIGVATNTTLVVTNGGAYRISFGSLIAGSNNDNLQLNIVTNGVVCAIVKLVFTSVTGQLSETGFKDVIVDLPALCRVGLNPTNANSANMTVQNMVLTVIPVN
jgi:hypothetical protein